MKNEKKVLRLKKLNPSALKDSVGATCVVNQPCTSPTAAPKPYYTSY